MGSIYYYSGSLTGSNLFYIPNNDDYDKYFEYNITNLVVCSSLYQILGISGSNVLFSTPIENTDVYYIPTTESFYPEAPNVYVESPSPVPLYVSSSFNWIFTPNENLLSSNNKLIITGSGVSVNQSQSLSSGLFSLASGSSISIVVSGSGQFYSSSLSIYNNTLRTSSLYTSSVNTPISTSFSSSFINALYTIEATVNPLSYIELTYDSTSNIPVSPTSSLTNWNAYLNITASTVVNSGSTVYLLGGNIDSINIFSSSVSHLTRVDVIGAPNLQRFSLTGAPEGYLTSFPTFEGTKKLDSIKINNGSLTGSNLPNGLKYLYAYDICNNSVSGNLENILQPVSQSIKILSCSYNNITGSTPVVANYPALYYLDCSHNKLSGSISSFSSSYALSHFNCSNNALTGAIPSFNDAISLNYFNASNNLLTGSLPDLTNKSLLKYFNVSNNQLSQSINAYDISGSTSLETIDISNNAFSGIVPIPFSQMKSFIAKNNNITFFPDGEVFGTIVPISLTYIDLENNNLTDVNLIRLASQFWITFSGSAISGTINVSGSGNASATSSMDIINYFNDLTSSGWTIYANDYP